MNRTCTPSAIALRPLQLPERRVHIHRFACAFLLDGWDVQLSVLGRAATPRDDGEGSLRPVAIAR